MSDKKYNKPMRFRDFVKQYTKISFTEREQRAGFDGFMTMLGMYAFLYAFLTAPNFLTQSYVSSHATTFLSFGIVLAFSAIFRWQYLEWRKRAPGEST